MDIAGILDLLPETAPYDPVREKKLNSFEKIDKHTFKIVVGCITGVAIIATLLRTGFHLKKRGKLFIDDWLVLLGAVLLSVETGLLYYDCDAFYLITVISIDPSLIRTRGELLMVFDVPKRTMIYSAFCYSTNYAIKASFLAFFRILVRDVSRGLNYYWWGVVTFTLLSWLYSVPSTLLMCPYFGLSSVKCFPSRKEVLPVIVSVTVLDICSDLMIASIPIILLRMSQIRFAQKMRIIAFLCLNIFIIAFALARIIGGRYHLPAGGDRVQFSVPWTHLCHHMEAAVAVIMGSLTAMRSVFATGHADTDHSDRSQRSGSTLYNRIKKWFTRSNVSGSSGGMTVNEKSPQFLGALKTGASIKGLKTFIRHHEREPGNTTIGSTYDPLEDYHEYQKKQRVQTIPLESRSHSGTTSAAGSRPSDIAEPELPPFQTDNMTRESSFV